MFQHSFSAPWAALNVSFPGSLPHKSGVHCLQTAVEVLSSLFFSLTFLICPSHISDAYEAAAELPQIAAWNFTENPTPYFSFNMPGHELLLHSLYLNSSPKSSGPIHDHKLKYGRKFVPILVLAALHFAFFTTFVIPKPLLCCFIWMNPWEDFHLYANRVFAQGCFSASHCNRVNHVLTTQPSSSISGSLSIRNFGNKWLKRIYWLLRVGFTSLTFCHSELRCQAWPGHLGFSRRIQYRGA